MDKPTKNMMRAVEAIAVTKFDQGQEHKDIMSKWCKKTLTFKEASEYIGKYCYRRSA